MNTANMQQEKLYILAEYFKSCQKNFYYIMFTLAIGNKKVSTNHFAYLFWNLGL